MRQTGEAQHLAEDMHAPADGERKSMQTPDLGTAARHGAAECGNASSRTRTLDPLIKSQLLYQLS